MYLRLKPCAMTQPPIRHFESPMRHHNLSRELYEHLIARNLEGFDWINGGQGGPIKFIDLHQFEFAIRRAREGSFVATLMVNLVLKGITGLCVPKHGGACQYSTGLQWNARNRQFTLSGQAIALQALALGATLRRRSAEFKLGLQINSFVDNNAHEIGLMSRTIGRAQSDIAVGQQIRGNAWYSIALHQFGVSYDKVEMIVRARRLFESIISFDPIVIGSSADQMYSDPCDDLDATVAITAALTYFGIAEAQPKLLRLAVSFISRSAPQYTHQEGGVAQLNASQTTADAEIDIDCTIDLVRACLALLRHIPDSSISLLARHCVSALFNPTVALARRPETGILLVASELAEVRTLGVAPVAEVLI